jgi:NTP pyrophosphatase (non-canonical NTP hydrolase)
MEAISTLNDYIYNVYQTSLKHGFWDGLDHDNVTVILSKLMLIVTEVAEAAEAVRKPPSDNLPFNNLDEELADICIRVFDLAGATGCDLQTSLQQKMALNESRPHMHDKLA